MTTATLPGTGARRRWLAERVAELKTENPKMPYRVIAERLGISLSYAQDLWTDPDGTQARKRKARYNGTCGLCGGATSGSNGKQAAAGICRKCSSTRLFGLPIGGRRRDRCGFQGCDAPPADPARGGTEVEGLMCPEHAPLFRRLREEFDAATRRTLRRWRHPNAPDFDNDDDHKGV